MVVHKIGIKGPEVMDMKKTMLSLVNLGSEKWSKKKTNQRTNLKMSLKLD